MRVLFSITYYHPYISGLTIAASRWVDGLRSKGHVVRVLCLSGKGSGVVEAGPNIRISKGFLSWDFVVKSWQETRAHDVVVINLPQFEGVIPAFFGRLFGKRVIVIYHCEVALPKGFPNGIIERVLGISNLLAMLLSHAVVTYTKDYADHSALIATIRSLRRDITISYIVPPIPKPPEHTALTKKLRMRIGKADFVIGVAARLASEKGIEYLFRALERAPGTLVIAGPMAPVGEEAYKEKIMQFVSKYGKRVVFLGDIHPDEMGSFYTLLDVLVLPSVNRTEAFGMVQVEAMRWGVPVVASDLPGVRIPVQKTGMGITVPPRDSDKIAEALARIRKNYAQYRHGGVSRFPQEQSVRALESLLSGSQDKPERKEAKERYIP